LLNAYDIAIARCACARVLGVAARSIAAAKWRRAFSPRTKAIILNTPNNPTGRVFTRAELEFIAQLCQEFDALAITDEIYEHILYDGAKHISMAALEGMNERTVTINGLSKSYSVTGWRVGWAVAPPAITNAILKVHDFLTVGAPAPMQEAGAAALGLPASESYLASCAAVSERLALAAVGEVVRELNGRDYRIVGAALLLALLGTLAALRNGARVRRQQAEVVGLTEAAPGAARPRGRTSPRPVRYTPRTLPPTHPPAIPHRPGPPPTARLSRSNTPHLATTPRHSRRPRHITAGRLLLHASTLYVPLQTHYRARHRR